MNGLSCFIYNSNEVAQKLSVINTSSHTKVRRSLKMEMGKNGLWVVEFFRAVRSKNITGGDDKAVLMNWECEWSGMF